MLHFHIIVHLFAYAAESLQTPFCNGQPCFSFCPPPCQCVRLQPPLPPFGVCLSCNEPPKNWDEQNSSIRSCSSYRVWTDKQLGISLSDIAILLISLTKCDSIWEKGPFGADQNFSLFGLIEAHYQENRMEFVIISFGSKVIISWSCAFQCILNGRQEKKHLKEEKNFEGIIGVPFMGPEQNWILILLPATIIPCMQLSR